LRADKIIAMKTA